MPYYTGRQYFSGTPRGFIIDSFCPEGSVVLIDGREGTGKTKLALAMAKAVATGDFFLGQYVNKGKIAWFNLDKVYPTDLEERAQELDPTLNFVDSILWYDGTLNLFDMVQGSTKMITQAEQLAADLKGYHLIVFDTLSELLIASGLDENSPSDTASLMTRIVDIARATGACVLVLHHMAKNPLVKGGRGATGIAAKCDVEFVLTGYKDDKDKWHEGSMMDTLTITVKKARTHKISIFPIELNAQGYVLNQHQTGGVPQGAWLGLISQRQAALTQFQQDCKWLEQVTLAIGTRLKPDEVTVDRRQLQALLHYSSNKLESNNRLDAAIAHFKNNTRLWIEQNGNNPYYHITFPESEIENAMKRRRRRQKRGKAQS